MKFSFNIKKKKETESEVQEQVLREEERIKVPTEPSSHTQSIVEEGSEYSFPEIENKPQSNDVNRVEIAEAPITPYSELPGKSLITKERPDSERESKAIADINSYETVIWEASSQDKKPMAKECSTIEPAETTSLPVPALNNNKPFTNLVEELVEIIDEFEGYSSRLEQEEARTMVKLFISRLYEMMERNGLELIDSDRTFSILRHTPHPMALVQEGLPLKQVLEPGLAIGNRVFRKAKVEINNQGNDYL